ncbi:MAG: hypothetical protein Q4C73_07950, partial [Eubacteriales bacterium]|nr:hypothetical protein [Eubacteriales bacterium]
MIQKEVPLLPRLNRSGNDKNSTPILQSVHLRLVFYPGRFSNQSAWKAVSLILSADRRFHRIGESIAQVETGRKDFFTFWRPVFHSSASSRPSAVSSVSA